MHSRACLSCRREIPLDQRRCDDCAAAVERQRHNAAYDTAEYRNARNAAVDAWVSEHGWVCPGDVAHPAHATRDLTADHPEPLSAGGQLVQDFRIRCRSSNSRRGPGRPIVAEGIRVLA